MQDSVFASGEGDAWFDRNKERLGVAPDPVLAMMTKHVLRPRRVLEVGCANGWRLATTQEAFGADCYGIDVSQDAIADGHNRYHELIDLQHGFADNLPYPDSWFDLTICHFVLHWVDRSTLLAVLAEMDRVTKMGGHIVIGDFLPYRPTKTPYHHTTGLWTYGLDYARVLIDISMYRRVDRTVFAHGGGKITPYNRSAVTLLQKEDGYALAGLK